MMRNIRCSPLPRMFSAEITRRSGLTFPVRSSAGAQWELSEGACSHDNVLSKALTGADSLSTLLTDPDGPATAVVQSASYPSMNSKSPPARALYCDVSQLASSHLIQCGTVRGIPEPSGPSPRPPPTPPPSAPKLPGTGNGPFGGTSTVCFCTCVRLEERGLWHGVAEGKVQISQTFNLCFASCNSMTDARLSVITTPSPTRGQYQAHAREQSDWRWSSRSSFRPKSRPPPTPWALQPSSTATLPSPAAVPSMPYVSNSSLRVPYTMQSIASNTTSTLAPQRPWPALFSCFKSGLVDWWDGSPQEHLAAPGWRFPRYTSLPLRAPSPLSQLSQPHIPVR